MINKKQIRIAVVDDHNIFRKGLIKLINAINDSRYFILFEAKNGKDMIFQLDKKALPDIIILDIWMNGMDGFESARWLQEHYPEILVLVMSMIETEDAILRMLRFGVKGYLSKDIETADLATALNALIEKGDYYTGFIAEKLVKSIQSPGSSSEDPKVESSKSSAVKFNDREREFIRYTCSDLTYVEIASKMFLSPHTIEGYRESVFRKADVKSRPGLVVYAIRNNLFNLQIG